MRIRKGQWVDNKFKAARSHSCQTRGAARCVVLELASKTNSGLAEDVPQGLKPAGLAASSGTALSPFDFAQGRDRFRRALLKTEFETTCRCWKLKLISMFVLLRRARA